RKDTPFRPSPAARTPFRYAPLRASCGVRSKTVRERYRGHVRPGQVECAGRWPVGALPFIEITPGGDAGGHDRCIYLRGVNGSRAGTELLSDDIWGLYFGVPRNHGLRVGDQLQMDLDPVGPID